MPSILNKIFGKKKDKKDEQENAPLDDALEESGNADSSASDSTQEENSDNAETEKEHEERLENLIESSQSEEISNDLQIPQLNESEVSTDSEGNINYEKEIKRLLEEDAKIEMPVVDYEIIQDVDVYDPQRNIPEESEKPKKEDKKEKEPEPPSPEKIRADKIFYRTAGLIAGALVLSIILIIVMFFSKLHKRTDYLNGYSGDGIILNQTTSSLNSANYIYVNQTKIMENEEKPFTISKMIVNSVNTVFYFEGFIDTQKYNFTLTDDSSNAYAMDLYFTSLNEDTDETMIKFEPLESPITKSLNLHIENPRTGKTVDFEVVFDRQLVFTPVRYLCDSQTVYKDDYKIEISNAVFSSSDSVVEYSIYPDEEMDYSIVQGIKSNASYVSLEEMGANKVPLRDVPEIYNFENNITLARMDFSSLTSLESNLNVTIKNLYKKYAVDIDIPATSLSQRTKDNKEYSFEFGDYKIVCEGLSQFNDKYVFVFHCEDKNIPADSDNLYSNRVEAIVEAQLTGRNSSGMEMNLDGICTSEYMGTDMIIPLDEKARDFISLIPRENISVKIKSAMVKIDDISVPIDKKSLMSKKDYLRNAAENFVKESFEKRLAYKSGELKAEDITGFSSSIMNDKFLMSNYAPEKITSPAEYSAQLTALTFRNDDGYGIVREVWKGINENEIHFYRTHKIHILNKYSYWSIESDEIIK